MLLMKISNAAWTRVDADDLAFGRIDLANGPDVVERPAHDSAVFHAPVEGERLLHVAGVELHVRHDVLAPDNGSTLGLVHDFLIVRAFDGIESTPEGFEARSAGFPEHVTLESLPDRLPDVLSFMGTNVVPTTRLTMIIRNDRKAELG